jgi:hypothetical protein
LSIVMSQRPASPCGLLVWINSQVEKSSSHRTATQAKTSGVELSAQPSAALSPSPGRGE